jgi:LPXTG-motif cell wall-anchored protein
MITQKGFSITKVEPYQRGETAQVKVYCVLRFRDHRGKDYANDATLVLDPANNWALTESIVQGPEKTDHRVVSYRAEADGGFRPPERVVDVATGPGGWEKEEFVFTKYEKASIPDDAFTLSAFGLPEPAGAVRSTAMPWYLWLGLAGGLCLALGGFFYWLKRRATTAATTS